MDTSNNTKRKLVYNYKVNIIIYVDLLPPTQTLLAAAKLGFYRP